MLLVTLAEELPVTETREALTWLARTPGDRTPQVVANRILPRLAGDQQKIKEVGPGPVREAALMHKALQKSSSGGWLSCLPDGSFLSCSALHTPPEVAARLADDMGED